MKKEKNMSFNFDIDVIINYVETINSIKEPMCQIKKELKLNSESKYKKDKVASKSFESIIKMNNQIKTFLIEYPNMHYKIYTDTIKQIMKINKGMISTRMIEPLNISRQYLLLMENNDDIEKVSRGIYLSPNAFEDSYFCFQQKYKKVVFSHMNALYFYDMTEEIPYNYTVTVPQRYHVNVVNDKCNVFYVSDEIYELGIVEIETPSGNKVRAYDKERCICDIIRSKNRMDFEHVKYSIREYIKRKDKDLIKLSEYSKKMGINKKVMEMVSELDY